MPAIPPGTINHASSWMAFATRSRRSNPMMEHSEPTWAFALCKENGAWVPISSDAKEVVRHAEIGVRVHHALVHDRASIDARYQPIRR